MHTQISSQVVTPTQLPSTAVLEAFNDLIAPYMLRGTSKIPQRAFLNALASKTGKMYSVDELASQGCLNIDLQFKESGWLVEHMTPPDQDPEAGYWIFCTRVSRSR